MRRKFFSHWLDYLQAIAFILAAFALIGDSQTGAAAVSRGLSLCVETVIPSLLPLLVLSRLLMRTSLPRRLSAIVGPIMGPLFHQPPQAAICLLLGLVGGYPVGAQTITIAYGQGTVTKEQGEHLLAFCNNAGPAFVFGIIGALLGGFPVAATLYIIHILSAILVGIILKPAKTASGSDIDPRSPVTNAPPQTLYLSIKAMAAICAYVILFQVGIAFLEKYAGSHMPQILKIGLAGALELSSGCIQLRGLDSIGWQYCLASGFLSFGGLCVWMQTRAVLGQSGLTGRYYLFGKLLQSATSILLTWAVMVFLPDLLPRHEAALYLPNHEGLLTSTLWTIGIFFLFFAVWCLILRKKAGNMEKHRV